MAQDKEPQGAGESGRSGFADRWKSGNGRPSSFVYIVLGLGVLTLAILLAFIYFSASERERASPPICTDISVERAERVVLDGEVERMTVVYHDDLATPPSSRYGPVLAKFDNRDETCFNLPQGIANQGVVYTLVGVIGFYNETTEGRQIEITYQRSSQLDQSLFMLPTETPTEVVETPVAPGTPAPDGTPVVIVSASPIATPALGATP
jgi:flagellar basal body-associated protein FliL